MSPDVRYLRVSYRDGKAYAAYFYLTPKTNRRSVRVEFAEPSLVIDFDDQERPLGIEILAPWMTTEDDLNHVLRRLGLPLATSQELAPLRAA